MPFIPVYVCAKTRGTKLKSFIAREKFGGSLTLQNRSSQVNVATYALSFAIITVLVLAQYSLIHEEYWNSLRAH